MKVIIEVYIREIEPDTGFRGVPVVGGDLLTLEGSKEQVAQTISKFGDYLEKFESDPEPSSLILSEN